jgi:hypothetical protein
MKILGLFLLSVLATAPALALHETNCASFSGDLRILEVEQWGANPTHYLYRGEDVTANVEATATEEFVVKNEGNGKTFKKFTVSKITFKANDGKKIFARGKVSSDTVSETGTCYSWSNAAVDLVGPKSEKGSEDKSNEGGN